MRATIPGFRGGSKSLAVKTKGKSRGALTVVMGLVVLVGLSGCLRLGFGGNDDAETRASKNAAEAAISREVTEMVKLYRICLQKHEDDPVKAKENCGMYKDAIRDLAPDNMRTVVAEVMDRLRSKNPSHRRDVEP
ncbi:MAG: hypothetical protein L0H94_06085 [Nitrospira sp.]|nr:hypothetical protein [Nitrospira sp.]